MVLRAITIDILACWTATTVMLVWNFVVRQILFPAFSFYMKSQIFVTEIVSRGGSTLKLTITHARELRSTKGHFTVRVEAWKCFEYKPFSIELWRIWATTSKECEGKTVRNLCMNALQTMKWEYKFEQQMSMRVRFLPLVRHNASWQLCIVVM